MASANSLRLTSGRLLTVNSLTGPSPIRQTLQQAACFSTTSPQCKRKKPVDGNKQRGVSALYRSGPRKKLTMSDVPLPRPRRHFKPQVQVDKNHGLWGFFPEPGKLLMTPGETEQYGRPWTVEELRRKSWEDLHGLWWSCCRERNFLATSRAELMRAKIGYGEQELKIRDASVKRTLRAIRQTLTERYYTWEDAVEVAKSDPEINLAGAEGEIYTPKTYEEEEVEEVKQDMAEVPTTDVPVAEVLPTEGAKAETEKEALPR